ncbi:hypothetical protein BOTBODRAFT_172866 [Botryobasidium botryosum FD-172 SS1]|uniref:FAD-binding PCMH-type domain-containing protein n=1 Tax=Botryobasidium botryosum (strain FD-172 SS1) TaxID=930990 RepID=A0A067MZ04_BOTB1|nr:hypothetical protein BOTBODRAFT_172866 [Botryobasidium botryosum FD-172 SS1]
MKFLGFASIIIGCVVPSVLAKPLRRDGFSDCLGANITTVEPSDQGYPAASAPFNQRLAFRPAAIVYPNTPHDVSQVVKCAASQGLAVNARSGGHSYAAYGLGGEDGHVIVDLSKLKSITLDKSSWNVVSETGNLLGELAVSLWNQGQRALPHGTLGNGGHAAFGGFGPFSRVGGLLLDRILSADVVLANGTLVTASTTQNSDLFWAVRGAGASFGIVTSWTFATLPAPKDNIYWEINYSNALSESTFIDALDAMQTFVLTTLSDEFSMQTVVGGGGGGLYLSFQGGYFGKKSDFENIIAPFMAALPDGSQLTSSSSGWLEFLKRENGDESLDTSQAEPTDTFFAKALVTTTAISKSAWASWAAFLFSSAVNTDLSWFVEMDLYGGAVSRVPKNATAFIHRDAIFSIQFYASSQNLQPPYPDDGIPFVTNLLASLDPNPQAAYANYVDPTLSATQWQTQYYGDNYQRLTRIKRKYDPDNVFSFPQSIGLAA